MNPPFSICSHYLIPQHLLSRLIGKLARSPLPFIKTPFIHRFAKKYQVNMAEALEPNLDAYPTFFDFFTRALKPDTRPIDSQTNTLVSPADGVISEIGHITQNTL